ncbi:polymer-forming cytoskeletal protein [Thermosyntropha sp.]|uniref:bactofilin family protein n=1 Tax=Thermosyntropha sp. TaxID=2740820 RepID=UPI0025CB7C01|nr:polymer-forming cytoskeletal protein [Thermosyntropha sp.]MBO8159668.1 polymer-forming cytoskeletal protein [Thermosyntropha sp.]
MLRGKKEAVYGDIDTFISDKMEVKGELNSKGSIRIDGRVEGKVEASGDVVLGEKGHIKGEIKAKNIIIAGRMDGNVHAGGRLEISPSGNVNGDVACSVLVVEEGGVLNGMAKMNQTEEKENKRERKNKEG